jgi:hypothetical protein
MENPFPQVLDVDSLKATDFVISLEQPFNKNTNTLYAPTLLMAWDELKAVYNTKRFIPILPNKMFDYINHSDMYLGSLDSNEYSVKIQRDGNSARVETYFNKSLPFTHSFEWFQSMEFEGEKVSGFGIHHDKLESIGSLEVLYYNGASEFAIRVLPEDISSEMIFIKNSQNFKSFKDLLKSHFALVSKATTEKKAKQNDWKYLFKAGVDTLEIPCIELNLEKNFNELIGCQYKDDFKVVHTLVELYQRNGFILNEKGGRVESYAVAADSVALVSPIDAKRTKQAKRLIFDSDFYVLLKKRSSKHPYFALRIVDAELLQISR